MRRAVHRAAELARWIARSRRDALLRRLLGQAGVLLGGDVAAALLGLAAVLLAAGALGPELFGVLVLITSYATVVDRLVNFQSWQAVVRFGAGALPADHRRFREIIGFCFGLDLLTALVATILACSFAALFGQLFSWPDETVRLAQLYSLVLILHLSGTANGLLRLLEQVRLLAVIGIVAQAARLAASLIVLATNPELWAFLLAWAAGDVVRNLALLAAAWHELHRAALVPGAADLRRSMRSARDELLRFVLFTNLNSSVRMASRELDVPVVGALLGAESAGLYGLAKRMAAIPARLIDPLHLAIYPVLSGLFARGDVSGLRDLGLRVSLCAGSAGLLVLAIVVLAGDDVVRLTVGADFVAAWPVLLWMLAATVVAMSAGPLQPAMLARGRPDLSLLAHAWSTAAYFGLLSALLLSAGLQGAGISYFVYYLVWSALMLFFLGRESGRDSVAAARCA